MTVLRLRHFWSSGGQVCSEASVMTPDEAASLAAEMTRLAVAPETTSHAARSFTELLLDIIPATREARLGHQEIAA